MIIGCTSAISRSAAILLAGAAATCFITVVHAADASGWSNDSKSAMRLIAGTNEPNLPLTAGIEIKLKPGWHTYWRYPGDSGIPPRFDFSGSSNLKAVEVFYPAPRLHEDDGGQSLGYKDTVIFPVKVTPVTNSQPVRLNVALAYAACERICIPANGYAELDLAIGKSTLEPMLKTAQARVPKPVSVTQIGLSARRVNGPKPSIVVDLQPPLDESVQLFAEGPTSGWALPIPKQKPRQAEGHRQFTFELDGLPPNTDPKGPLDFTFTIVSGDSAFEVKTHLD